MIFKVNWQVIFIGCIAMTNFYIATFLVFSSTIKMNYEDLANIYNLIRYLIPIIAS